MGDGQGLPAVIKGRGQVVADVTTMNNEPEVIRLYTLEEVAQMTGMALRTLQRECRANRITHIHKGRMRAMTADQINELITRHQSAAPPDLKAVIEKTEKQAAQERLARMLDAEKRKSRR